MIFLLYNAEIQNAFYRLKLKGVKFFSIGKTALSKNILCTHVGEYSGKQIIITGGIHAREYITTLLCCRLIEIYKNKKIKGGIYFIPMVNPDGIDLCINETKNIKCEMLKEHILSKVQNFKQLKANSNLVDLNVNFDAKWGRGKSNLREAGAENFIGYYPHSEKEVKSLVEFTKLVNPALTISYHSKGEEIYYNFNQKGERLRKDLKLAKVCKSATGYKIVKLNGSTGGYKDYCIDKLGISALTIEVGSEDLTHPIGKNELGKILKQNLKVPQVMLENLN